MTSAPRSANRRPSSPPATMTPRSRIRIPSNGRAHARRVRRRLGRSDRVAFHAGSSAPGRRRRAIEPDVVAVDDERADRHRHRRTGRDRGVGQRADRPEVRRAQRLRRAEHRRDRHPAGLARGHQLVHRLRREQLRDQLVELPRRGVPGGDRVELGVGELLGLAQPGPHAAPLPRRQHADPDVAVAAREDRIDVLVSGPAAPQLGGPLRPTAACPSEPNGGSSDCDDRFEAGEVDVIACAATQPVDSRRPAPPMRPAPPRWPTRCPSGGNTGCPVVGPDRDSAVDNA